MHQTEKRERDGRTERDLNVTVMRSWGTETWHPAGHILCCRVGGDVHHQLWIGASLSLHLSSQQRPHPYMRQDKPLGWTLMHYKRFTVFLWTSPTTYLPEVSPNHCDSQRHPLTVPQAPRAGDSTTG